MGKDGAGWLRTVRHLQLPKIDGWLLAACGIAQLLSLLLCVMGSTSEVLSNKGINAPATQSLVNYALLAISCSLVHLKQHGWKWKTSNAWYLYALLAFLDVEGNFLVTKAYQYTSITSVTLLDCFTVPAVMVLSYFALRARYSLGHSLGALLCVLGLTVLVLTDRQSETGGANPVLGDVLVICGACIYAICNVSQEWLLVSTSQWELLAHLGCFGTLFGGVQAAILEHSAWTSPGKWDGAAVGALLGFAAALYTFSLLIPLVLRWGGATVLNLSLLTSDVWAAGARSIWFGGFGGTGSYFALALVAEVAGIFVYTVSGANHTQGVRHKSQYEADDGLEAGHQDRLRPYEHPGTDSTHQSGPAGDRSDERERLLAGSRQNSSEVVTVPHLPISRSAALCDEHHDGREMRAQGARGIDRLAQRATASHPMHASPFALSSNVMTGTASASHSTEAKVPAGTESAGGALLPSGATAGAVSSAVTTAGASPVVSALHQGARHSTSSTGTGMVAFDGLLSSSLESP